MITRIGITGWQDDSPPEHPTPPAQFSHAFGQIFGMLGALFNRHSDIGIQHLTGPIGMSRMIYQFSEVDVRMAMWFAFIINVNLAILNLLPIPVLDGGHILFFTIARLRRRELPLRLHLHGPGSLRRAHHEPGALCHRQRLAPLGRGKRHRKPRPGTTVITTWTRKT